MKNRDALAIIGLVVVLSGCGPRRVAIDEAVKHPESPFVFADSRYSKGDYEAADSAYQDYIERNEKSSDNQTLNRVTVARIRQAYTSARRKKFKEARTRFQVAAKLHKGKDRPSPDHGLLADQAKYQSIVCLAADGKKAEAISEYKKFLIENWQSPVCYSVIKRLHMMLPKEQWAEYDKLMEAAVARQTAVAERESAVCGPKALAYLLEAIGKGKQDRDKLYKLCGTTGRGTTMAGMRKGLNSFAIEPVGLLLNRLDFPKVQTPALWLGNDHYYVLLEVDDLEAKVWDPKTEQIDAIQLPPLEDANFNARVLALGNPLKAKASS